MSDYPNARDCQHGQLRRSCELCERDERIAELEAELVEAREDTDRVDWLIENAVSLGMCDEGWEILDEYEERIGVGDTPRAAIDEARGEKEREL